MTRLLILSTILALAGCRDLSQNDPGDDDAPVDARSIDGKPGDAQPDASGNDPDGTPIRLPCTSNFGTSLSADYGRLDGILVAIVPPGTPGCNSGPNHVHLQVRMAGSVYDVAVNVAADATTYRRDVAVDTTPWAEGWHTTLGINYPGMGIHSTDFIDLTTPQLVTNLVDELSTVNHISIYSTGYGPDGTHLVHRNNSGNDGAIVMKPLSNPPRVRMYRFVTQTF